MVKGCRPLRRSLQVRTVMGYMLEEYLNVSALGAANWWRVLEKVAIIVRVDLLKYYSVNVD